MTIHFCHFDFRSSLLFETWRHFTVHFTVHIHIGEWGVHSRKGDSPMTVVWMHQLLSGVRKHWAIWRMSTDPPLLTLSSTFFLSCGVCVPSFIIDSFLHEMHTTTITYTFDCVAHCPPFHRIQWQANTWTVKLSFPKDSLFSNVLSLDSQTFDASRSLADDHRWFPLYLADAWEREWERGSWTWPFPTWCQCNQSIFIAQWFSTDVCTSNARFECMILFLNFAKSIFPISVSRLQSQR